MTTHDVWTRRRDPSGSAASRTTFSTLFAPLPSRVHRCFRHGGHPRLHGDHGAVGLGGDSDLGGWKAVRPQALDGRSRVAGVVESPRDVGFGEPCPLRPRGGGKRPDIGDLWSLIGQTGGGSVGG